MLTSEQRPYTFDRVFRMLLTAGSAVAAFALIRYLSDVLLPFVAAAVLAYLLNPLVRILERRLRRRWAAVALTLSGLGILALTALLIILPLMASQWERFQVSLSHLRSDVSSAAKHREFRQPPPDATSQPDAGATPDAASAIDKPFGWQELQSGWEEYRREQGRLPRAERLKKLFGRIQGTRLGDLVDRAAEFVHTEEFHSLAWTGVQRLFAGGVTVINFAVEIVAAATMLIIILIYLVFLLLDFPSYVRTWKSLLPPGYRGPLLEFLGEFETALRTYFRGQTVVACCTGILFATGFTLIGLPMAIPFGLFVGTLNMVPYLQTVALVPAAFLAVLHSIETGSFVWSIVKVLAVFGSVQILMDGILTPRIMGHATGLRPVSIMLGVFIWGKLLGFLGLLLAIPLTCLGIAYYRRFVLKASESPTLLESPQVPPSATPASSPSAPP